VSQLSQSAIGGAGKRAEVDGGYFGLFVDPVAKINDLLVGAGLQGAGVALDQLDKPGPVGKTVLA
jgi:hypothetical protein